MYAYINNPNRTTAALASILISGLTTGFASALVSYDMDTSPYYRKTTPDFYGFVPPTGRGVIFSLMVVNSACQFLAKTMAIALLGTISKVWAVAYLAGDVCLFLLYKTLRRDLFFWIPIQGYSTSIIFSLLFRVITKVGKTDSQRLRIAHNLIRPSYPNPTPLSVQTIHAQYDR